MTIEKVSCECGENEIVEYGQDGSAQYFKGGCDECAIYFEVHVWRKANADPAWFEGTNLTPPEETSNE